MTSDQTSPKLQKLFEDLNQSVEAYYNALWEEDDVSEPGDFINQWALVINYGNFNQDKMAGGYDFEVYPPTTPPHAAKGLLKEGIQEIEDVQYRQTFDLED